MKIRASMMILVTAVAASAAHAEVIDVTYTGTIYFAESASADPTTLQNFANASGETITGSFTFDTVSDVVSNAMLGNSTLGLYGVPAVAGSANLSSTDAIYVQGTNAGVNGPRNTSISVDLSALTSFAGTDPGAFLLQGTSALAQQVDFTGASSAFPSTVIYYDGASDGSDITQIDAYLTDATVSVVPLARRSVVVRQRSRRAGGARPPPGTHRVTRRFPLQPVRDEQIHVVPLRSTEARRRSRTLQRAGGASSRDH